MARLVRPAAELVLRVVPRVAVPPVPPAERAVVRVDRAAVPRVDRAAVLRVDELAPVAPAVAAVLDRPAERLAALVLTDRVLLELAGLRRAVARVVVCTDTEFPPS